MSDRKRKETLLDNRITRVRKHSHPQNKKT